MLWNVDLFKSVVSSEMIIITETKVIDNIIEVCEPVLHHNDNNTPMYGSIAEGFYDMKKVMGEVFHFWQEMGYMINNVKDLNIEISSVQPEKNMLTQ